MTVPEGSTVQEHEAEIAGLFDAVRAAAPQLRVVDLGSTGDPGSSPTTGAARSRSSRAPNRRASAPGSRRRCCPRCSRRPGRPGFEVGLTSYVLLAAGGDTEGPSVLAETLFGAVGALLVLIFVFASFLAFVPLIIAAVSILTTFLLVLGLTYLTDVSFVVQFLIALVGLGVAIDYSLLLVSRWREERAHGHPNDEAVVIAMRTAGHAVVASGVTVAISLLALIIVPVPFLRSMGLGGMLIPLVSVAVVLTLLPAMLSKIGPRVDWPRIRHDAVAARGWSAWARLIVRRRWIATGVAVVLLALLIVPVFHIKIGQSNTESLTQQRPRVRRAADARAGRGRDGVLTPIAVLVPDAEADAAVAAASGVPGVRMAVVGGSADGTTVVDVVPGGRDRRQHEHRRGRRRPDGRRGRRRRRGRGHRHRRDRAGLLPGRSTTTSRTCWH